MGGLIYNFTRFAYNDLTSRKCVILTALCLEYVELLRMDKSLMVFLVIHNEILSSKINNLENDIKFCSITIRNTTL